MHPGLPRTVIYSFSRSGSANSTRSGDCTGYENLSRDFNVFLVGDATLTTFPANKPPQYTTNAHISFAALNQLITQVSWVKFVDPSQRRFQSRIMIEWQISVQASTCFSSTDSSIA